MNPTPFPFEDFRRAKQRLQRALLEHHEPFVLLTGETGTGKTALLRELRAEIDRTRYRVVYFAQARKLGAVGLIKVLGEGLRVRPSLCHALSLERLLHALAEDPRFLLLWLDEAHELLEAQAGDLLAHSDAPPQGRLSLELGTQLGQADEQDLDGAGAGEVALGDGTRLGEGLHRMTVINRGSWGELRFERHP